MRTVLATISGVNIVVGALLGMMFVAADDVPPVVLAIAMGLLAQGAYTVAYQTGYLHRLEPWSGRLLLGGETVALLVGTFGFAASAVTNINPKGGDYEFAPLAVGLLIAFHAGVALWMYALVGASGRLRVQGENQTLG